MTWERKIFFGDCIKDKSVTKFNASEKQKKMFNANDNYIPQNSHELRSLDNNLIENKNNLCRN